MDDNKPIHFYPTPIFKIPIDSLSNIVFELDFTDKKLVVTDIVESNRRNIKSKVTILNGSGEQITEFDRAVLNAAISEIENGNTVFTANIIFRHLGGSHYLTEDMRRAILESFNKLSVVRIQIEAEAACKKKILKLDPKFNGTFNGYLLPTESITATINGQTVDAIRCLKDSKSISFYNANLRDQIISCQQELLNAPVKSTPRNIALNHYLLRRTLSIKGSNEIAATNKHVKPLRKIISLEDLYKHCGVNKDDKRQKQLIRQTTEKILKYFVEKQVISNFTFETGEKGKVRSIILEFTPQ